jgi:CCN3 Nov like TSP1 domain
LLYHITATKLGIHMHLVWSVLVCMPSVGDHVSLSATSTTPFVASPSVFPTVVAPTSQGHHSVDAGTNGRNCDVISTQWSPCSKTCDVGTSMRITNDNNQCRTEVQVRLCLIRPCAVRFPDVSILNHKQFLDNCKLRQ